MFSSFEMPANNLGATSRFYRKQVYLAWQNCRPTLCNKQARWPSAVADLLAAYVSKLRNKQWCSIDSETLTLRTALSQWHEKPVFSMSIHSFIRQKIYSFVFHSISSFFILSFLTKVIVLLQKQLLLSNIEKLDEKYSSYSVPVTR